MTRTPFTLSVYIGRQFLLNILLALSTLTLIAMMVDLIELMRRAAGREYMPFGVVLQMVFLRVPYQAEKLLAFAILFGSMFTLARLTRTYELVVARSTGVSVWQFLLPALGVVLAIGFFAVAVFNPLSAVMLLKYEKLEGKYFSNQQSLISVSKSGLWLRQVEEKSSDISEHIIYAKRISQNDLTLSDVILFTFDKKGVFRERYDASRAALKSNTLTFYDVTLSQPGKPPEQRAEYTLPTTLKIEHIQDSFASPETTPFWQLPGFINTLEQAGFSALRHRIYLQSLLASPLLYVGMVLVAAVFSLRLPRQGRISLLIMSGAIMGLTFYFFTDVLHAFGSAGTLPIVVAAWVPACIMLMLGSAALLHLEDG